jgi:Fe-S oxidoreductase
MALFNFLERENLYFPGCFSEAYLKPSINNYKRILKKLNIDFRIFNDFFCCAGILEEAGYEKQTRKLARENLSFLKEKGVKRIITSCANCYRMFSQNYSDMIPDWDIKVEFILEPIFQALKSEKFKMGNFFNEPIVYYDSCYLSRYLNFYETPREIMKIIGFNVIELPQNKKETLCCGSCGLLPTTNPDLSKKIARNFIQDLKQAKVKKIITADPLAYKHLLNNLKQEDDIQVLEFSEVLCDALGIKKEVLEKKEE